MEEGWIKLHRKSKNNLLMRDHLAWTLFCHILLSVNRDTGIYLAGRFTLARELGAKPNTVYKALLRLQKKYKVVTLSSNNRYTEIRVLNWDKYQYVDNSVTPPVTTQSQHSNTKQELRIKKYIPYNGEKSPEDKKTANGKSRVKNRAQFEALRIAKKLNINLSVAEKKIPSIRARWFRLFKIAEQNKRIGNIQTAYSYCFDHTGFQSLPAHRKILLFFWKFNNSNLKAAPI